MFLSKKKKNYLKTDLDLDFVLVCLDTLENRF